MMPPKSIEKSFEYVITQLTNQNKLKLKWSTKNGNIQPNDISRRTAEKYYFDCVNPTCGHEVITSPDKIFGGNGCPYCCNPVQKLCGNANCNNCFVKSFASHPRAINWILEKNGIEAKMVSKNSNSKYWLKCFECNHEFYSVLTTINKGVWCPFCSNKELCDNAECNMCLTNSFASNSKAVYWSNKNEFTPRQVFKSCNKKFTFNCDKATCGHEFEVSLCNIAGGKWCPYCGYNKLCDNSNGIICQICYDKSFASHSKSYMWCDEKNEISKTQVFLNSGIKRWFKCNDCNHHFETVVNLITRTENDKYCPYCSNQILCDVETCEICNDKSLASHEKAIMWNYEKNNGVKPRDIFKNSNFKYWFNCDCGHTIEKTPNSINRGCWCPYCCNPPIKLCDDDKCKKCFEKSFASHPKSKFWSDKNTTQPRDVFINNHTKHIFTCSKKHQFSVALNCINNQNTWCPKCVNKTEGKFYDEIIKIYDDILFQVRFDWCRNSDTNQYLPFDYVLEEQKIIIELDGKQHFTQVKNWASPEDTQKRDKYKMHKANTNGYSVIRILQMDVLYDKYKWIDEIKENIKKIMGDGIIQNIYMCKKNEYSVYQ